MIRACKIYTGWRKGLYCHRGWELAYYGRWCTWCSCYLKPMIPTTYWWVLDKIKTWFSEFLTWMTTHEYGILEMNSKNNHGTSWAWPYHQRSLRQVFPTCLAEVHKMRKINIPPVNFPPSSVQTPSPERSLLLSSLFSIMRTSRLDEKLA